MRIVSAYEEGTRKYGEMINGVYVPVQELTTAIDDCAKGGGEEFFTEIHCVNEFL